MISTDKTECHQMIQLLNKWEARCPSASYELGVCACNIMILRMAVQGDILSQNHSSMNTKTKGNSWHDESGTEHVLSDKLSTNHGVIVWIQRPSWPEDPSVKSSHCYSNEKEMLLRQTVKNLPAMKESKIFLCFYDTFIYYNITCLIWQPHTIIQTIQLYDLYLR